MKKFIMALVLMPLMALAGTEKIGDVTWSFTVANGEATVTGASPVSGVLEIPSTLGGCPVTSIGEFAVYYCTSLTSVTIPEGVTSIGEWAFSHCHGLTSVTIPSSVMSIGNCAFRGCSGLTSVTIPSSVTSIGHSAFRECSKLTEIVVATGNPSYCSVEGILYNKSKSVLIQCPGNKEGSVTIPSGVTSIGLGAFEYCHGLTSVTIPSSVTSVGDYAFYGCSGLKDADGFVIVKDVLYGYYGAAWSVTIPDGVTSIGYGAFWSCSSMRSVTIPSSVTSIGNYAFYHCYRLASVTIPSSVTNIGEWAFYHCYGLVSVTISSSVTSIGSDAFNNCSALKVVYAAKGDAERVAKLYQWASSVEFVEIDPPVVEGDEGATVVGDPDAGFVIKLSEGRTAVEVTIPQGVDAAKVTVEVSPKVVSVKPNGAKVKIVSGGADITECLNVPAADGNGVVDLTKATVKEEIVKETMDVEKGAKIVLDAADPKLTTAPTRVGLFYQLREGETLGGMKDGDSKVGDGQPWSPKITVKGGNSAFYSIGVGKGE